MSQPTLSRFVRAPLVVALAALPFLAAAEDASPAAPDAPATGSTISFAKVVAAADGSEIGHTAQYDTCVNKKVITATSELNNTWTSAAGIAFKREVPQTHVVSPAAPSPFESDNAPPKDADYKLGGALNTVTLELCFSGKNVKGSMDGEVRWDVYSNRLQKVVLSKTMPVAYKSDTFTELTASKFAANAFGASLKSFFSDADVKALLDAAPMQPPPPPPPPAPSAPVAASVPEAAARPVKPLRPTVRPAARAASAASR